MEHDLLLLHGCLLPGKESSIFDSTGRRARQQGLTLPAMLGRPHRTTRFDRLTTEICRTNGKAENRKE